MEYKRLQSPPPVKPATREQVSDFLRGLQKFRAKGDEPIDQKAIRDYINQQSVGSLQGISRRIMMDILKSPTADPTPAAPQKGRRKRKQAPKPPGAKKKKKAAASRKAPKKKASRKK
jgi:hypothetical protein